MAKEGARVNVQMRSPESGHTYWTSKNKRTTTERLELKKYDPKVRKHVVYKEKK
ncbi:MAG: 50S ribosomal protein L33 [Candidatus Omnitrophota bacterium]|nr:50S ribosomal protein L33 [Candidatus Omnitrophota bacterium]